MIEPTRISLVEARSRLARENIDLVTTLDLIVRVTIQVRKKHSKFQPNIRYIKLSFARSAISRLTEGEENPCVAYFGNYFDRMESIQLAFGIQIEQPIWFSSTKSAMTLPEALDQMYSSRENIHFLCKRAVLVAVYPRLGLDDEILPELGVELHFGEPGAAIDRYCELYQYSGHLDADLSPSKNGSLTLEDVRDAFEIDPDQRIWEVGEPGDYVIFGFRREFIICAS